MPPKGRGGRSGAAALALTAANNARTSSRLAVKAEAAQQAAAEQAAHKREAAEAVEATDNAPPDSSMPPPTTRGRGRGRPPRGSAEGYARRGTTRRGSRSGSSIASFSVPPDSSIPTSEAFGLPANGEPFTPQRASAADLVYGNPDSYREASQLAPRTPDATANLMNKVIDRLYGASKDLISHLAIEGEERDESWVHELRFHKDDFDRLYKVYAQEPDTFIDIDVVSQRTKSSEIRSLWERIIKGVATANLANLLSDVEDLDGDPSNVLNRLPLLERIDNHFPAPFTPEGQKGLDENRDWLIESGTVQQSFTIRTHRLIETLRGVQQISPVRLFAKIFHEVDVDNMTDDILGQYIETVPYKSFAGFDINDPAAQKYQDAISSFRSMVTEMDANAVISSLEQEYPFDLFLTDLKVWIKDFDVRVPGPARTYNGDSPYSANAQLQAEATASQQPRFTLSGIARLRQHLEADPAAQQAQSPRTDTEASPFHNSDDLASITGTDAEALAREHAEEMAGMAGQAQYLMSGANGAMYAAAAADTAKRGGGRKRGRKSAGDGGPGAKRARAADSAAMPPPPLPSAPLGPLPAGPAAFDPVALSRHSQLISKANRKPPQPKQRKPWTTHDCEQLVRGVDVYKAKWSTIEKAIKEGHIPFNVPERDQQGLRDKARLVKVDVLKTDTRLPASFNLVVLGRKEKEMVIAVGRNPDRREEDVDADGNPSNTLYNPNAVPASQQDQQDMQNAAQALAAGLPAVTDANDLRPLQEAQMVAEAPMGGAPDAPMATAEMDGPTAPPSESLGEAEEGLADSSAANPPIDPNMSEAGPSSAAGSV